MQIQSFRCSACPGFTEDRHLAPEAQKPAKEASGPKQAQIVGSSPQSSYTGNVGMLISVLYGLSNHVSPSTRDTKAPDDKAV